MRMMQSFTLRQLAILMAVYAGMAHGQSYPQKSIRFITAEAGGAQDMVARATAQAVSGPLGQPIIVDNHGGGVIPGQAVAKSAPDGYTLLVTGGNFWLAPLQQKVPYDPLKDFVPVSLLTTAPNVMVVNPSVPAKTVEELIALAKAEPGKLNTATGSTGSSAQLAAVLFNSMAKVDIVNIYYKSTPEVLTDLIAGRSQIGFPSVTGAALGQVKAGKLRALAITTARPSALAPGLPTISASGLPGFEIGNPSGMFAPAHTPSAIISRLNTEIARGLNQPEMVAQLQKGGAEVVASSSQEFDALVKSDVAKFSKILTVSNAPDNKN